MVFCAWAQAGMALLRAVMPDCEKGSGMTVSTCSNVGQHLMSKSVDHDSPVSAPRLNVLLLQV